MISYLFPVIVIKYSIKLEQIKKKKKVLGCPWHGMLRNDRAGFVIFLHKSQTAETDTSSMPRDDITALSSDQTHDLP